MELLWTARLVLGGFCLPDLKWKTYSSTYFHLLFSVKKFRETLCPSLFFYCYLIVCFWYSADEPMVRLQHKVSDSLKQGLEKLKLSENISEAKGKTKNVPCPFYIYSLPLFLPASIHSFTMDIKVMPKLMDSLRDMHTPASFTSCLWQTPVRMQHIAFLGVLQMVGFISLIVLLSLSRGK